MPGPFFRLRLAVPALLVLSLAACAGNGDDASPQVERPAELIYSDAATAMEEEDYRRAAQLFDEVERQHPYSSWATRAQLMSAFAHYQALRYDDAILALDNFIQLHPGNESIPYAYYLKALCYYERITDVERDQGTTQLALNALGEVVARFPDTDYARDARLKIDLTRDQLAGHEMTIGRFYLNRAQYNAAINRFRRVVDEFQTTTHVPEALHRLTEAYLALGLVEEAQATAAVLGHNYPGSEWYRDSYALVTDGRLPPGTNQGFLGRAWSSVF